MPDRPPVSAEVAIYECPQCGHLDEGVLVRDDEATVERYRQALERIEAMLHHDRRAVARAAAQEARAALTAAQDKSEPANLATAPAGASGLGSEPYSATVERMAKAMHRKAAQGGPWEAQGGPWEAYIGLARAALTEALRGGEDG